MDKLISNPADFLKMQVNCDFVVNEFPRIKVQTIRNTNTQDFKDLSKAQREMLLMRLIEKMDEM